MADKAKGTSIVSDNEGAVANTPPAKCIHVRLDGKTKELIIADLNLTSKSTDEEILAVLAKNLRVDIERFSLFSVDRRKDGNIFLRPDALFSER